MGHSRKFLNKGFSFVELLVAIIILGILLINVFLSLNPFKQLDKAYDAQRVRDLSTVATALDTYYNDTNCYPRNLPFGSKWSVGDTIYMQKVPSDPQASAKNNYLYLTDISACPQWNIVFSKLSSQNSTNSCKLPSTVCLKIMTVRGLVECLE